MISELCIDITARESTCNCELEPFACQFTRLEAPRRDFASLDCSECLACIGQCFFTPCLCVLCVSAPLMLSAVSSSPLGIIHRIRKQGSQWQEGRRLDT